VAYIDRILQPGEQVIRTGRMHWIVYAPGMLLLFVALAVAFASSASPAVIPIVAAVIALFGVAQIAAAGFEKWTTEIVVTNRRVVQKRGFIRRDTAEMNMDKVESVIVNQSLMGRILGYGNVVVRGTGTGIEGLHHIADPLDLRSAIVVR
jgi:uncharacterized membrane protein YdbT with pleckstrin-like domain